MERETFARRLQAASNRAVEFGRQFLLEDLPDAVRYRVRLNQSYDGHAGSKVSLFPDDGTVQRAFKLHDCDATAVVELLWRGGAVPEWIDISVVSLAEGATLLELLCCGRFNPDDDHLYYTHTNWAPFGVKGPTFPASFNHLDENAQWPRFSIFDQAEAWDRDEVESLRPHAEKIWSLSLEGPLVDDAVVDDLPRFGALEILECRHTAIIGRGLAALGRQPRLRVLRITHPVSTPLTLMHMPKMRQLTDFELRGLPNADWGFSVLRKALPRCRSLTLVAADVLHLDGQAPSASEFVLVGHRLEGRLQLPRTVKSVSLRFAEFSQHVLETLFAPIKTVRKITLSDSPVSVAMVEWLLSRYRLQSIDVTDCGIANALIEDVRTRHPNVRIYPRRRRSSE